MEAGSNETMNRTDQTDRSDRADLPDQPRGCTPPVSKKLRPRGGYRKTASFQTTTVITDLTDQERWALYAPWLEHDDPAVRANALICLINQANYPQCKGTVQP